MTDDYIRVRDAQGLARPSTKLGERALGIFKGRAGAKRSPEQPDPERGSLQRSCVNRR